MILKRKFYNCHTIKVAQDLLGCYLVRKYRGKTIKAKITETEAYRGQYDLASHASHGETERTKIMYDNPGHAYIYMIYGMHFMLNIVTEKKGYPAAVLIRGVEIQNPSVPSGHLPLKRGEGVLDGPGKLTKYLHINKSFNGYNLTKGEKLWLERPLEHQMSKSMIIKSPRVGIGYARHCQKWKWNFRLEEKYFKPTKY